MFGRFRFVIVVLWTVIAALWLTNNSMAYIGPGGGMEFIGYAMGLIAMLGAAFLSFILWPFYRFLGWLRGTKANAIAEQSAAATSVADASAAPPSAALSECEQPAPPAPSVP